jgi:hypothetical protein
MIITTAAAAAIVPLGHKWLLVIIVDCVSKKYWVLLPLIYCDISCYSWPCKSGPSIVLCFVRQLRCCTRSSIGFLICLLIILYTVFLIFHCSLSVLMLNRFSWNLTCTLYVCPKYFKLLIVASVSRECLGIIWLVTDAFILITVCGISSHSFIYFRVHP